MSLSATMRNMSSIFHLLIVGLTVMGCAHRVVIESDPPGATIRVGHKMVGVTPAEVKVRWVPFKKTPVTLSIPGKRRVQLNLSKDLGPMRLGWQAMTLQTGKLSGKVPRVTHRALFVEQHGPVGTWNSEDVP